MFKWLTIILVVLSGFLVVLLSLGYILKEHKEVTTALVDSIEHKRKEKIINEIKKAQMQVPTGKVRYEYQITSGADSQKVSQAERSLNEEKQQIVIRNLLCQSDQQCVLVDIQSSGNSCVFLAQIPFGTLFFFFCSTPGSEHRHT